MWGWSICRLEWKLKVLGLVYVIVDKEVSVVWSVDMFKFINYIYIHFLKRKIDDINGQMDPKWIILIENSGESAYYLFSKSNLLFF